MNLLAVEGDGQPNQPKIQTFMLPRMWCIEIFGIISTRAYHSRGEVYCCLSQSTKELLPKYLEAESKR